ncbi:hypothetical protein MKEN_01372300 [Mycena kentingensis (nom. inval.)]|nr:hypothetical protein MKEN_01372300 [Mycena kentingensis (nom. inval.)]
MASVLRGVCSSLLPESPSHAGDLTICAAERFPGRLRLEIPATVHAHVGFFFLPPFHFPSDPMDVPIPPNIVDLTLPIFLGSVFNWMLLGILLVQVYIYFRAFPTDQRWSKIGVALVLLFELIETSCGMRDMARVFGAGWGNLTILDEVGWVPFAVPVMGPWIASIGQTFFAYRLYIIGRRSVYLPILVTLVSPAPPPTPCACIADHSDHQLSLLQLAAGIWTGVNIANAGKFSLLKDTNIVATALWLSSTSLCDLLIVGGMAFYLLRARDRAITRMSAAVSRILFTHFVIPLQMTVETGFLCAACSLIDLYLFVDPHFKNTQWHLVICIALSKVYSNSILLVRFPSHPIPLIFNSRVAISHKSAHDSNIATPIGLSGSDSGFRTSGTRASTLNFAANPHPYPHARRGSRTGRVSVLTTRDYNLDLDLDLEAGKSFGMGTMTAVDEEHEHGLRHASGPEDDAKTLAV